MNFTCCTVPQKKYKGTLTTIIYNRQVSTYDVVTVRKLTKKDSADLLTYVLCLVQITYIAKKKYCSVSTSIQTLFLSGNIIFLVMTSFENCISPIR